VATLARSLDRDPRFEPLVALDRPEDYAEEPIQRLLPLRCPTVDRQARDASKLIEAFAPEVVIVDNHFPAVRLAPRLFVLWHGFGWRGPNDRKEFAEVYKSIRKLTGERADRPNERFLWQCFGPTDLEHRNQVSGFDRSNLASLGSAFTDDLLSGAVDRETALDAYPPEMRSKRVALLAFTWHYGRVFSHWGDDIELFRRLLAHLEDQGWAAILRLHDRHRYEPAYLDALSGLVAGRDDVLLKFKDQERDNLLDLTVADLMVSNFSSILNYFYATGRPSIHVYPVSAADEATIWRIWKRGKVREKKIPRADYIWKLPPEENGGVIARSFEELLDLVTRAAVEPDCCAAASRAFIDKHMAPVDGHTCRRIADAILSFAGRSVTPR
jgi:hypothetical protein